MLAPPWVMVVVGGRLFLHYPAGNPTHLRSFTPYLLVE